MSRDDDRPDLDAAWSRAHGGLDPSASVWVRGWLRLVRGCVRPLVGRGLSPDVLTLVGVVVAVAVPVTALVGGAWPLLGAVVVVLVAVLDGLDGALALADGTSSAWGRVLDPLADRVTDLLFLLALWWLGASGPECAALAVLTLLLELVRASAHDAGLTGVGVVTVWERPSRVIVAALVLAAGGVHPLVPGAPSSVATLATAGVVVGLVLAVVGLVHLTLRVRADLRG